MKMLKRLCLFLFVLNFAKSETPRHQPSVIVVGAGAAGIAAATKLLENSFTNVTILEAGGRIGGRIRTRKFGGGTVEMGAEVCDGSEDNLVYDMVKDLGLLHPAVSIFGGNSKVYYHEAKMIDSSLARDIGKLVNNYVQLLCNESDGVSVGEAFSEKYSSEILENYNDTLAEEGLKLAESVISSMEGAQWDQPSAKKHNRECRNDKFYPWKGKGFKIIFDILTKSYPNASQKLPIDEKIRFNKRVSKIIWNTTEGVTVQTSDSSSYTADYVIFSPSLGVLKKQKDTLFDPKLPDEKLNVIEALGFGTMMKIFLHFPSVWWHDEDAFFFIWNRTDFPKNFPYVPLLKRVANNPNVLAVWIGGEPELRDFATVDDRVHLTFLNLAIRRFLGFDYNLEPADKLIRTTWSSDPNFEGTYSYEKKEHFRRDVHPQEQLAEPLKNGDRPAVLFAGEATSSKHYGTVQGAIESGWREAERIIRLRENPDN